MTDVRYKQRFENYEKSFLLLKTSLELVSPSIIEKAGAIKFFETTFELAWKLLKDYRQFLGYETNSPRNAIKQAFSIDLIGEGSRWLDALTDRNLTVYPARLYYENHYYHRRASAIHQSIGRIPSVCNKRCA